MGHSGDDAVHEKSNKIKTHWPNWLKFLVFVYSIVLFRTRYKELDVILVQCPSKFINQANIFVGQYLGKQKIKCYGHCHDCDMCL